MFKFIFFRLGSMLKRMLALASYMDHAFQERLNSRDVAVVVRTKKEGENVQYLLENGQLSIKSEDHPDPDVAIIFSNAANAYFTAIRPTPRLIVQSVMEAIEKGDLRIEFQAESLSWIFETLMQMPAAFNIKARIKNRLSP